MMVRYARIVDPAYARSIYNAVEGDPANPKHSEVRSRRRGGSVTRRLTPRLDFQLRDDGSIVLGAPVDGWTQERVAAADASITFDDDPRRDARAQPKRGR